MARAEVAGASGTLTVTLAFSGLPREVQLLTLVLPSGSTVADALRASGWLQAAPELATLPVGIWGKLQPAQTQLRDRDRIELYRPLRCDPKVARRERYQQKKQRSAASQGK